MGKDEKDKPKEKIPEIEKTRNHIADILNSAPVIDYSDPDAINNIKLRFLNIGIDNNSQPTPPTIRKG